MATTTERRRREDPYGQEFEPRGITAAKAVGKAAYAGGKAVRQNAIDLGRSVASAAGTVRDVIQSGGPLERNHTPAFNPTASRLARDGAIPKFRRLSSIPSNSKPAAPTIETNLPPVSAFVRPDVKPVQSVRPAATAPVAGQPVRAAQPAGSVPAPASGPRVFSDGSEGMQRTQAQAQGQGGGSLNVVPSSAFTRPSLSDILGHTPTEAEGVQYQQQKMQRPNRLFGDGPSAAQFAQADRNNIATGDWRSAAGNAAHVLQRKFGMSDSPSERAMLAQQLQGLTQGTNDAAQLAQQGQNAQGLQRTQNQGLFRNTQLAGQNAIAQGAQRGTQALAQGAQQGANQLDQGRLAGQNSLTLERQRQSAPAQQVFDDGSIGLVDPQTGAVTPVTLPGGKTAKAAQRQATDGEKRAAESIQQLNDAVLTQLSLMTEDEKTPENISNERVKAARGMGLRIQSNAETGERVTVINGQVVVL